MMDLNELNKLLNEYFKKRIFIISNNINCENLISKIDDIFVVFDLINHKVFLSYYSDREEVMEEIINLLSNVIDEPICKYQLTNKLNNKSYLVVEWNKDNPKERIEQIKAGKNFINNVMISNLVIYNKNVKQKPKSLIK